MERPYTGLTAKIKINETVIGYMNSVELNLDKDIIEILQFGATYKEKVPAIKNWTASTDGTVAFASGESQEKLYQAYESGEYITLEILLKEDAGVKFVGKALVSNLSISGAPDDALNISAEFEGSGGVTLTLPQTFLIAISSGVGGTTDPAGDVIIASNTALKITVTPSTGKIGDKYYIDDDKTGVAVSESNEITLPAATSDHTVRVTFKDAPAT